MGILAAGALPAVISSAGTVASGIAGTVGSAISNRKVSQLNNAFSEKMLQKQMDYNTEMYERQLGDQWKMYEDAKQYNSAGAQRERLEAAGLNAGMIMGGGSAGTVSSVTSPSAQGITPPRGAAVPTDYSGLSQIVGDAIGAASALSQKRKTDAETYGVYIENQYKGAQELARLGNVLADTKSKKAKTLTENLMRGLNAQLVKGQISLTQQQTETEKFNTQLKTFEALAAEQRLNVLPLQLKLDLSLRTAQIQSELARGALTKQQARTEVWRTTNEMLNSAGQKLDNDYSRRTMEDRVEQQSVTTSNMKREFGTGLVSSVANLLFGVLGLGVLSRFGKRTFSKSSVSGNTVEWKN